MSPPDGAYRYLNTENISKTVRQYTIVRIRAVDVAFIHWVLLTDPSDSDHARHEHRRHT